MPAEANRVEIIAIYTDTIYGTGENEGDLPVIAASFSGTLKGGNWEFKENTNDEFPGRMGQPKQSEFPAILEKTRKILKDKTGFELVERPKGYIQRSKEGYGVLLDAQKKTNNGISDTGYDILPNHVLGVFGVFFMGMFLYFSAVSSMMFATLGAISHGGESEPKDGAKTISDESKKAWRDASAELGSMKDQPPQADSDESWDPWREQVGKEAVPAFRFSRKISDADFAKLPVPSGPFGLDFHCGFYAGISLKQIAKMKTLYSLNLGAADQGTAYSDLKDLSELDSLRALYLFRLQIKDSQLKHLAKMQKLQVLDLSNTRVTDEGVKELAKIKSLRWLNLKRSEMTATGVAQLQKELPDCKIVYDSRMRLPGHDFRRRHSV